MPVRFSRQQWSLSLVKGAENAPCTSDENELHVGTKRLGGSGGGSAAELWSHASEGGASERLRRGRSEHSKRRILDSLGHAARGDFDSPPRYI